MPRPRVSSRTPPGQDWPGGERWPVLADSFGRIATDLRVSVTDRCNLRCRYCMPADGLDWLPNQVMLTDDEVCRLISVAVRLLGISEVRFTGGEPLIRRGLPAIIARTCARWARRRPPATWTRTRCSGVAASSATITLTRLAPPTTSRSTCP